MALTTRAIVLQHLGLTDDATAAGAFALNTSDAVTATYAKSGNTLTLTDNAGANAFDLTLAAFDTMGELVAAIDALTEWEAVIVPGVSTSLASALLDAQSGSVSTAVATVLTYSNTAAGTVAALIDNLILEAEMAIARYCGRIDSTGYGSVFESAARTDEEFDGTGGQTLQLRAWPVSSVSSVKRRYSDGTTEAMTTDTYRVDGRTGRLFILDGQVAWDTNWDSPSAPIDGPGYYRVTSPRWTEGQGNYLVTYTGGYATVPYDLRSVATDMVVEMYMNRRNNGRASSDSVGGHSTGFRSADDVLKLHRARLDSFKTWTF